MGIVTMMMVFGTMTMNGNNVAKNDKNNHGKKVVAVNNKAHNDKSHFDKGNNDGWDKGDKKMYDMGKGMKKGHTYHNNAWFKDYHMGGMGHNFINVHHCMYGFNVKTKAHHHVYANEMVNGHHTGHMICIYCAKHMH